MNRDDYRELVELHVQAFLDLIKADSDLAPTVFEGDVKGDPDQFTNVFHDAGFYEAHSQDGTPVDVTVTFTVHSAGVDRWQAQWGAGRVTAQVLGVVPTIPGRRCWRIKPAGGQPVHKDTTVTPPKFLAVTRFTLKSTPKET